MERTIEFFPSLSEKQKAQYAALDALYREWNEKINVISRKDIDNLYTHHVLHSLAIAKAVQFMPGESVLDLGTGGGFPGIPLAIMFPETRFTLCDSIGKKVRVAQAVADSIGLENVTCVNCRAESLDQKFDYVVSRAVTDLKEFVPWVKGRYGKGIICLKGGGVEAEIESCSVKNHIPLKKFTVCDIDMWFKDEYFNEKKIVIISQ